MSDLISREEAFASLERIKEANKAGDYDSLAYWEIERWLDILPSAEKTGTWKNITLYPYDITGQAVGECSLCGKQRIVDNYCSNCGARMVE